MRSSSRSDRTGRGNDDLSLSPRLEYGSFIHSFFLKEEFSLLEGS
jgi:hypothetical protein